MSCGAAVLAAVALQAAPAPRRWSPAVMLVGAAAGWMAGAADRSRYLGWPPEGTWSAAAAAGALGLFALVPALAVVGNRPTVRATPALAMVVLGAYLCVPETGALRLLPGPLVVVAIAVAAGWLPELGGAVVVAVCTLVGWLALVDGATRPASIIGALGCVGALLLLRRPAPGGAPHWSWTRTDLPAGRPGQLRALIEPGVVAAAVALCSRWAGVLTSTRTAAAVVVVVLAAGRLLLLAVPAPGPAAGSGPRD